MPKINLIEFMPDLNIGQLRIKIAEHIATGTYAFSTIEGTDNSITRIQDQIKVLNAELEHLKLHRSYLEVCKAFGWKVRDVSDYIKREPYGYPPFVGTDAELLSIVAGTEHEEDVRAQLEADEE